MDSSHFGVFKNLLRSEQRKTVGKEEQWERKERKVSKKRGEKERGEERSSTSWNPLFSSLLPSPPLQFLSINKPGETEGRRERMEEREGRSNGGWEAAFLQNQTEAGLYCEFSWSIRPEPPELNGFICPLIHGDVEVFQPRREFHIQRLNLMMSTRLFSPLPPGLCSYGCCEGSCRYVQMQSNQLLMAFLKSCIPLNYRLMSANPDLTTHDYIPVQREWSCQVPDSGIVFALFLY